MKRNGNWRQEKSQENRPKPFGPNRFRGRGRGRGHGSLTARNSTKFEQIEVAKLENLDKLDHKLLVSNLTNDNSEFLDILAGRMSHNCLVLAIKVISKICESTMNANTVRILSMSCEGPFREQLQAFILELPIQDPLDPNASYYWNNVESFWGNLLVYGKCIMTTIPMAASASLMPIINVVHYSFKNLDISSDIKSKFEELKSTLNSLFLTKEKRINHDDDSEPPNDFREMSIYPTFLEVTTPEQPFIRHNVIKGSYKNVDHYLDVQFRLLREDFVAPLREGICYYLRHDTSTNRQDIRMHPGVMFLGPSHMNRTCGILVQFKVVNPKAFENSRRFMHGSLLCFTKNNFRTLLFGRIIGENMRSGLLLVDFDNINDFEYNTKYVMVECNIYFEPYYHVLKTLQKLNEFNFPMKRYIVDLNTCIKLPSYCAMGYTRTMDQILFNTLMNQENISLNDSQYRAYKAALNQEFVIIQGPPGTGKTFLGLQIVKTLLQKINGNGPLLVISYTNHALDQFLEGILKVVTNIVRVGGQSQNDELTDYNIKARRLSFFKDKSEKKMLYDTKTNLINSLAQLTAQNKLLPSTYKYDGIIAFSYFINLVPELANSWFAHADAQEIINWLLDGYEEWSHDTLEVVTNKVENIDIGTTSRSPTAENVFDNINRKENYIDYDDIDYEFKSSHIIYYLKCSDIKRSIKTTYNKIQQSDPELFLYQWSLQQEAKMYEDQLLYLKMRLREGKETPATKPDSINLNEPFLINSSDRWKFYFYWLELFRMHLFEEQKESEIYYNYAKSTYESIRTKLDIRIMSQSSVVGMTTTSAARLHNVLQDLKCPIVVVEEAAEILESHIVASLTRHCQHLILIGDHLQLRPSTANYTMEKEFKLGISLFERMVSNEISCNTLEVQHRMRPEIASLITPAVYPVLQNHKSVYEFPKIRGISTSLYFITHEYPEETCGTTKSNPHEAEYLLQLSKYLIQNGYDASDITILAAYSGQTYALLNKRKEIEMLQDVNIKVLDNYQGEESKIILLSLVRNNSEGKIGFLSIENRVCVALSRAREGLYIMGNMNLLCLKSNIWPKIRQVLENQNSIGKSLSVQCQTHNHTLTTIENVRDFQNVRDGGCNVLCEQTLECGHVCKLYCHPYDHTSYKCKELCERYCERNHKCKRLCHEACNCPTSVEKVLPCGHVQDVPCFMKPDEHKCTELVSTQLPCTHLVDKPCHYNIDKFICPVICGEEIRCGHLCKMRCHTRTNNDPHHLKYECWERCTKFGVGCTMQIEEHLCPKLCSELCAPCDIKIKKMRFCQHLHEVKCRDDVDKTICHEPCYKTLSCDHPCKLRCNEPCGNCSTVVEKTLPSCQHKIKVACSIEPTRNMCYGQCPKILPCGHRCQNRCNEPCSTSCGIFVLNTLKVECGHIFNIPCHFNNEDAQTNMGKIIQFCKEPCNTILACGHICTGTCGECYQGRIHKPCPEACKRVLICGHRCMKPCSEICHACDKPCTYTCEHKNNISSCKQTCSRVCKHQKCTAKCGQKCSVPSCEQPCPKILPCGHPCIGFCGNPCPPLCSTCNKDELESRESKANAKFVLLEECGHVFNSDLLENLMKRQNPIEIKRCPKCDESLTLTAHYRDYIKNFIHDVLAVKNIFHGTHNTNEKARVTLAARVNNIFKSSTLKDYSQTYVKVKQGLQENLKATKKKLGKIPVGVTTLPKVLVFEKISAMFGEYDIAKCNARCIDYANLLLEALFCRNLLTSHEVDDFKRELRRLEQILLLEEIGQHCDVSLNSETARMYDALTRKLYSAKKYVDENVVKHDVKKLADMVSYKKVFIESVDQLIEPVGLNVGIWYKCEKGHIYTNNNCFGTSTCTLCGFETII